MVHEKIFTDFNFVNPDENFTECFETVKQYMSFKEII